MVLTLKEQLRAQGYAVVEKVFAEADLAQVTAITNEMIKRWQDGEIHDENFWAYGPAETKPTLYRIHNLEKQDPCINGLLRRSPLTDLVGSVLGEKAAPTACALVIKMPFCGGRVPYHCDPIDVEPATVYNFSIFLDDSTAENGCLEVVPGSHLLPAITKTFEERPEGAVFVTARAGDVVVHDVRILHGSAFNHSQNLRRSIVVEFQPAHMLEFA